MAIIAEWHRKRMKIVLAKTPALALGVLAGTMVSSQVALADTTGTGFGFTTPIPGTSTTAAYGNIQNEYVFCNVGYGGTWTNGSSTLGIGGRIAFGNTGGSAYTIRDDSLNLCGWTDVGGVGAASPFANSNTTTSGTDWPAYLRVDVDGTQRNVGFASADNILAPDFRVLSNGPALVSEYSIGTNLRIHQEVRVRRSMVRFEWTIINDDTAAHSVSLRWNTNVRSNSAYYFRDSGLGVNGYLGASDRVNQYTGGQVPDELTILNRRADDAASTAKSFAMKQIFRGADTTLPNKLVVVDSDQLWPGDTTASGNFDIDVRSVSVLPYFRSGIATAAYYNNINVAAGGGRYTVVAYAGNGTDTQQIGSGDAAGATTPDYVLGVGGPEALVYNTAAALDATVLANRNNPTLATVGAAFLTSPDAVVENPRRFKITASAYNQKLNNPLFGVRLEGVSLSLTLPQGLKFAVDPTTGVTDVASKAVTGGGTVGSVDADKDGQASWWVEATGEKYGPLTYQVTASVALPAPLSRSVTRTIVVPTPPVFSYKPGVFQLTGIPFSFDNALSDNALPATVLNTNVSAQDTSLSLWEYTGNANRPYQLANKITLGKGYFFRPSIGQNGERIVMLRGAKPSASQAPTGNATALPQQIQLEAGWNLVANPYVYEIPLNYFRFVINGDTSLVKNSYQAAVDAGVIRSGVYTYNATTRSYDILQSATSPIIPWQGYWIYAEQKVVLEFTTPTTRGSLIQPTAVTSTNPDTEPATRKINRDTDWRQQLVVRRDDGAQDKTIYLAAATGSAASETRNLPKPPPIDDYIYGGLVRPNQTTRYASIVQPAVGKQQSWDLEVVSDKDGNATISWPGIAHLPRRVQLKITDLQTGRSQSLRSTASLNLTVRKGVATRYRITSEMAATQPLRITSLQTRGTRGGQSISVQLSKDATLTARVLTQTGRPVQVLASGRSTTSGSETTLTWNQRDQSGNALPAGIYLIEVVASGSEGETPVRMSRPISVLR